MSEPIYDSFVIQAPDGEIVWLYLRSEGQHLMLEASREEEHGKYKVYRMPIGVKRPTPKNIRIKEQR